MAFGLTRLNERHQRPNALINFIKPLKGTNHEDLSQDFLERIAAIVYPVMRAHTITVMSLEEFPPNREFVGRNFNAGESIQLVLKSHSTGQWLSFRSVQMVMMHELAHCKQMNHSRAFWAVRNTYADHLRVLWDQSYLGEGVWGRGQTLVSGRFENDSLPDAAGHGVESLCGGAYRGQKAGNKRKRLTYAQRRDRRIEKKFGKHGAGNELGEDYDVKAVLEKGRRTAAKPKVAGSKRGRELRAAAALARFDQSTSDTPGPPSEVETESEDEYDDMDGPVLLDDKGKKVKDAQGNNLVRICEAEDLLDDDENVRREMDELQMADRPRSAIPNDTDSEKIHQVIEIIGDDQETVPEPRSPSNTTKRSASQSSTMKSSIFSERHNQSSKSGQTDAESATLLSTPDPTSKSGVCPICSLKNEPRTATCLACAHVLNNLTIKGAWSCTNPDCSTEYLNAGDCGVCGLCGRARPKQTTTPST